MRTNIGPSSRKRASKKRTPQKDQKTVARVKPVKRKMFGGVKGGRKKADPDAARRAQELKKLREQDAWFDDDDGDFEDVSTEPSEQVSDSGEPVEMEVCVDDHEIVDAELAEIVRDIEGDFSPVDDDTANVLRKANEFLDETKDVADVMSKTRKGKAPKIPSEVAKNLAALHFFNEDESRKKDAEFDINAIVGLFKSRHRWYDDSDAAFKQTVKRFFGNHRHVSAIMVHFLLTVEEFMKLFISKYVDRITPEMVRNDIIPCVAKVKATKMSKEVARFVLSSEER